MSLGEAAAIVGAFFVGIGLTAYGVAWYMTK